MAQPKRKSPEKKPAGRAPVRRAAPSVATRALQSTVAGIARYPRLIGGVAIFGVVFSFVAANALWYQPKHHPSPLLATRLFGSDALTASRNADAAEDPHVTTFRIERQQDSALEEVPLDPSKVPASPLIREVQQALATRGLYDGPADGLTGPKTTAAILFFQETEGLEETGDASVALLAKLQAKNTDVAVIPDERPSPDMTGSTKSDTKTSTKAAVANDDEVADLIRSAEPATATRSTKVSTESQVDADVSPETVMKIQRALSRFAYAQVKVDGVAGEATKAAIRAFEKNYNLPVTGKPSERIVKKLKSIGAI